MKTVDDKVLLTQYYQEMLNIMDTIKVGVFITDGEGNVMMINKESARTGGMRVEDILGKNMKQLQEIGYVDKSCVLKAIKNNEECRMIQRLGDGDSIYITAVPHYKNEKIDFVVCTERDITETKTLEKLLDETKKLSEKQAKELAYLRVKNNANRPSMIAESSKMQEILHTARRIAQFDITVMITGDSGTGKEVLADYIVKMSNRSNEPFVKINCAAIPETLLESELFGYEKGSFTGASANGKMGMFEMARGGTIFLDEIAEIPLNLQAKLLRVLQEKEIRRVGGKDTIDVDVRIIAATNVDLKKSVEKGEFREDLYYRLNVVPIKIPPLKERKEDIKALSEHFVRQFGEEYGTYKTIQPDAMAELVSAQWEGNIRELRNMMERLVVSFDGEKITAAQVRELLFLDGRKMEGFDFNREASWSEMIADYEKELLLNYMEKYPTAAEIARQLQVDKSTICRKMKKYNISKK